MKCLATTCCKEAHAKGYCTTHLARFNRGADIEAPVNECRRRTTDTCSLENCNRPYSCKNLCSFHYKRKATGVSLTKPKGIYQRGRIEKTCPKCSTIFTVKKSEPQIVHCSRSCAQKGKTGELNGAWKGGITSESKMQRVLFTRTLLQKVLARDNYTCQICLTEASGDLQVDHIKRWSEYPELRFDMDNCRTLCRPCHYYVTLKRKMPDGSKWGLHNVGIKNL